MDFEFDYNSLSERFCRIKSELDETIFSLEKLKSYKHFVASEDQKQVVEKNAYPEKTSAWQVLSNSESEESASDNDYPLKKVSLQSAVITVRSSNTRKKFIRTYNLDNKIQLRNRRFLGMVQNTLQKFQAEEVRRQPQDLKRKKAIEKVEAAVEEEKNSVKRQKVELLSKSRKQQMELECLEKMMRIVESFELWENNQKYLLNYIGTKTEPQIFFLPTFHSFTTKKKLEKSRIKTIEKIEKQKAYVKEILARIRQSYDLETSAFSTKGTSPSKADSSHCELKQEIAVEDTKDTEEILYLDLSENECEDFY